MDVYKEMYLQLFNKISDIIKDLQDVQASAESLFAEFKPDTRHTRVVSLRDKQYIRGLPSIDPTVVKFSLALNEDEIDADTLDRLEDMIRQKKDALRK